MYICLSIATTVDNGIATTVDHGFATTVDHGIARHATIFDHNNVLQIMEFF